MEALINEMWNDAARQFERNVSAYHPRKVRCLDISETSISPYEETTESVFEDIDFELGISSLKAMA